MILSIDNIKLNIFESQKVLIRCIIIAIIFLIQVVFSDEIMQVNIKILELPLRDGG